jgi:TonB-linked SusC/RagA family outer membrane protein
MRKLLATVCLLLFTATFMYAQEVLKGTVKEELTGDPMPGVTVFEKGTSNGTITDPEGKYEIKVKDAQTTLIFRYVGYATTELTGGGDISLKEDVLMLDEVVVTALGIKSDKKALGYSVQTVGGDALTGSGESNMINGLNAKVAGVQVISSGGSPGAASFIRIRGSSSLTGNNQPLIVIDGVPMDNSQNQGGNPDNGDNNLLEGVNQSNRAADINPNDVENVTVLKGPAAAALYGIQAANGAILITTKKGSNTKGKGVAVSFNSSMAWDKVNKLPENQTRFSQGFFGEYQGPESGRSHSWGAAIDTLSWDNNSPDPNNPYIYDNNGAIVSSNDPSAREAVTPYDNYRNFFQTGLTTDNSLSLSGGNAGTTYRFSIGNTNTKGIVPLSSWGRTTAKFAGESQLTNRLRTAASVGYSNSGGRRVQTGSNTSGLMLGLLRTPITFDNSNGVTDPADEAAYIFSDGTQRNYRGGGGYDNPYWTINKNPFTDEVNRIYGFTSVSYDVTNWLNVFYRVGTDTYSDERQQVLALGSRSAPAGRLYYEKHNYRHINSDLWVTAQRDFTEKLSGSLLVGNNLFSKSYSKIYTQGDGFVVPDFNHISNASSTFSRYVYDAKKTAAIFGEAKLSYDDWIFLDLTGRNEWSSTLPTANNSFFYPSANLGVVVTEALGMTENKILPYGKLRLSYASVGHDAPSYALGKYFSGTFVGDGWTSGVNFPYNGIAGFSVDDVLGSNALRPEKNNTIEIGTDLRFIKNRIGVDFTFYRSRAVDQILAIPVAGSSGYTNQFMNAGTVSNTGFEITLNATPVKSKDFRWDLQVNFTRNKNMVVSLPEGIDNIFLGGFEGSSVRNVAGQPYGQIYGGTFLRDANGNLVIESDTNSAFYGFPIESGKEEAIGNPNPDFLCGFSNTLTWKGISLNILFDFRKGGQMWNGTIGALANFGMSKVTEDRDVDYTFEGVKGTLDGDGNLVLQDENGNAGTVTNDVVVNRDQNWYLTNGGGFGNVAEQFIQETSWIRLREVSLSYSLPTKLLEKTPIAGLNVGISGRNLLLITPYEGIDPETNLMGSVNAQGLDYFNMPNTRSISARLGINF